MSEHKQCPACGAGAHINSELTVYPVAGCTNPDCFLYGLAFHIEEWDALRPIEDALHAEIDRLTAELALTEKKLCNVDRSARTEAQKLTAELAELRERFEVTDDLLNHATVTIGAVIACCTYNSNEDAKIGIYGISPYAFTRIDQFITNYNRAVSAGKVSVDVKTVISEGSEPSQSDVSVTQDVLMDIKKDDTCPECGGCGEVAGAYYSGDGVTTCDRCNGKGTI